MRHIGCYAVLLWFPPAAIAACRPIFRDGRIVTFSEWPTIRPELAKRHFGGEGVAKPDGTTTRFSGVPDRARIDGVGGRCLDSINLRYADPQPSRAPDSAPDRTCTPGIRDGWRVLRNRVRNTR